MDETHHAPMDTSTDSPSLDSMKTDYDELHSINLQTRIHALRRINRLMMFRDDESRTGLLHVLNSRLLVEEDKDAKALIVMALEKLAHLPSFDGSKILQILMNQTETDSTKLKCQIYDCIFRILKIKQFNTYNSPDFARLLQTLSKLVIKELSDSHHRIRSICIQLLTSLPSLISRTKSIHEQSGQKVPHYLSEQEIQTIIRNYGTDVDPRVRRTALKSLLRLHQRGCKLELSLYDLCKESLKDDYEEVRIEALNLIWVLSSLYPDSSVKPFLDNSLDKSVRLVDDAFVRICDIISDVSVNVRSKASTLLGSYRQAEDSILLQTFSKEKMTNFGRQKGRYMDDVKTVKIKSKDIPTPEGDFDVQDEFRLLDSGACGAFVHGLEDEYQDVRYATIDSICELCMHNSTFAEKAVDFLVDMFHDEIDSVRLNAINSLRKISTNTEIVFNREQLTIALSVLDDADPTVRESTHGLLRAVRLAERDMVMKLIEIMKNNVTRYPEDQLSIYQCFRDFGAKHNDFIEYLVPVFFTLEQGFKPVEKHVDDPKHIGHVIMTFNAAHSNSKILEIIPDYLWRHYTYLRDKFPSCFLEIQMPSNLSKPAKQKGVDSYEDGQNVQNFMEETLTIINNLESLFKGDLDTAKRNARVCLRDLKYIAHVAPLLSGKAEFAIMYLECVKIIIE
ncbi:4838_t:CDS:10, partial [Paraglomus brasilianum]